MRGFLSDDEERAWHGLVEAHDSLTRLLDARLVANHHLPLGTLQALIEIAHAEDGSISVSDLAERIRLSPSRTSRLAIQLERQGLVERQRDAADTRSTRVAATQAGRDRLLEAAPTYLSTIRTHLFEGLGQRDVKQLARILGRIQAATRPDSQ
jgi:DNA-binding MarR family transcriptional regulator